VNTEPNFVNDEPPSGKNAVVWLANHSKDAMPKASVSFDVYTPPSQRIAAPYLGQLREDLPATVALLKRRRADLIAESAIDAYVELNWLEWRGGGLKLTIIGENLCKQMTVRTVHPDD
jgi:hypothetical protein